MTTKKRNKTARLHVDDVHARILIDGLLALEERVTLRARAAERDGCLADVHLAYASEIEDVLAYVRKQYYEAFLKRHL